jgi:hypothetical protein
LQWINQILVFFVGNLCITSTILLFVIDLFKWLISSCFNLCRSNASSNLSIFSKFGSSLKYKFLKYSLNILWSLLVFVMIFPFSLLILLTWVFYFFLLVSLVKGLSILFTSSKNQLFVSLILCIVVLASIWLISTLIFFISFWQLILGLTRSYFSKSLRCILGYCCFLNVDTHSYKLCS